MIITGEFDGAESELAELISNPDTQEIGHRLLGTVAFRERRFSDARDHFLRVRELTESDSPVLVALVCLCDLGEGQWESAARQLRQLELRAGEMSQEEQASLQSLLGPESRRSLLLARCLLETGQPDEAAPLLESLESTEYRADARVLRIRELTRSGKPDEARSLIGQARKDDPESLALVLVEIGFVEDEQSRDAAERVLHEWVRQHPDNVRAGLVMAEWFRLEGKLEDADRLLSRMRVRHPGARDVWLLNARVLMDARDNRAIDELMQQMATNPAVADFEPLARAQWKLYESGMDAAADALRQVDPTLRRSVDWKSTSALVALGRGEIGQAVDLYGEALRFTQTRQSVGNDFVVSLARLLDQSESADSLAAGMTRLRERYPHEPSLILAELMLAARRKDYAAAHAYLAELEQHDSVPGRPGFWKAWLLVSSGDHNGALKVLQGVLSESPDHVQARLLAARIKLKRHGNATEAQAYLDGLSALALREPEVALLRFEVLRRVGQSSAAARTLIDLIEQQPRLPEPWLRLADYYAATGHRPSGIQVLERASGQVPANDDIEYALVDLLLREGRIAAARERAKEFLSDESEATKLTRMVEVFLSAGDLDGAELWMSSLRKARVSPQRVEFLETLLLQDRARAEQDQQRREELLQVVRHRLEQLVLHNSDNVAVINNLA